MKFIPERPVTIHSVRHDARFFPFVFKHTDRSLLLYVECGYDAHFSPFFRMRSTDNGKTWQEDPVWNVPRVSVAHSFKNGELLEIDTYGVLSSNEKDTYIYYGVWSYPSAGTRIVKKDFIKVYSPSCRPMNLEYFINGYPTYKWWELFNMISGKKETRASEIFLGGPYFTDIIELEDGKLVAAGYWYPSKYPESNKYIALCYESTDRGKTWIEKSIIAGEDDLREKMPEGFDEPTLIQLKDKRLYAVMRTGRYLYHTWSEDLGKTWKKPEQLKLVDSDREVMSVWPKCRMLDDGTLILVYGRPGKDIIFDPTGTGSNWQGHFDLQNWEIETQEIMGVPENQRLITGVRYRDSGHYLGLVITGKNEMLVFYDVQNFVENWNSYPVSGIRMVKLKLE